MRPRRAAPGFTLIELAIVLALIALLLTIAAPRYFHTLDNGRLSVQRQNIAALRDAIDKFQGDQGRYPDTLDELVQRKYLRAIPVDPVTDLPNWAVVAPQDALGGGVYDVRSAAQPIDAAPPGAGRRAGEGDRAS